MDCCEIWSLRIFLRSVQNIQVSLISDKKTYVHLRYNLAEFFLEWEIFQKKVAEKIKTHILCPLALFPKIVPFIRYCGETWYSHTGHRWQYYTVHCFACWITKATDTHSEYSINIAFPQQEWLCEHTLMLWVYVYFLSYNQFHGRESNSNYVTLITTTWCKQTDHITVQILLHELHGSQITCIFGKLHYILSKIICNRNSSSQRLIYKCMHYHCN